MARKKWQQPLIFSLEVDGKVWDRVEGGPHHIVGKTGIAASNYLKRPRAVQWQFHYTMTYNNDMNHKVPQRASFDVGPSDVAVGMLGVPGIGAPGFTNSVTRKLNRKGSLNYLGTTHFGPGKKTGYDLTINLSQTATAAIGPS